MSGYFEMSKVNDMETSLIRDIIRSNKFCCLNLNIFTQIFRMIAFSHRLPTTGQRQLKDVLSKRFRKIAKKLREFQFLSFRDKEEILTQNIPFVVEMQICQPCKPVRLVRPVRLWL